VRPVAEKRKDDSLDDVIVPGIEGLRFFKRLNKNLERQNVLYDHYMRQRATSLEPIPQHD
jgi:hypothetical protein